MTMMPDLNELCRRGVEVTLRAGGIVWSGKTRLLSVDDETATILTKMGAERRVKRGAIEYLSFRPAPFPNPPQGEYVPR